VILILAAFLTPPDVISQLMLGIPTYLLFELTLIIGRFLTLPHKDNAIEDETEVLENEKTPVAVDTAEYNSEQEATYPVNCYHRRKKRRVSPVVRRKPRK
jgi:sec-independent protein translocase protein TatC